MLELTEFIDKNKIENRENNYEEKYSRRKFQD